MRKRSMAQTDHKKLQHRHSAKRTAWSKQRPAKQRFNPDQRINGRKMTDREKMDAGFNGVTYTINGIEYDF